MAFQMKTNFGPSPGYIISLTLRSISFYVALLILIFKNWEIAVLTLQQQIPITDFHLTLLFFLFIFWALGRAFYIFNFTTYNIAESDNSVLEVGRPYSFFGKQVDGIFCHLITDCDYRITPLETLFKSATIIIESADNKRVRLPYAQKELLDKLRQLCPKIRVLGTI